ncbi:hypothetical protein THIOSC13_360005 [uncultured Thiomicrorhabdus sp.]
MAAANLFPPLMILSRFLSCLGGSEHGQVNGFKLVHFLAACGSEPKRHKHPQCVNFLAALAAAN